MPPPGSTWLAGAASWPLCPPSSAQPRPPSTSAQAPASSCADPSSALTLFVPPKAHTRNPADFSLIWTKEATVDMLSYLNGPEHAEAMTRAVGKARAAMFQPVYKILASRYPAMDDAVLTINFEGGKRVMRKLRLIHAQYESGAHFVLFCSSVIYHIKYTFRVLAALDGGLGGGKDRIEMREHKLHEVLIGPYTVDKHLISVRLGEVAESGGGRARELSLHLQQKLVRYASRQAADAFDLQKPEFTVLHHDQSIRGSKKVRPTRMRPTASLSKARARAGCELARDYGFLLVAASHRRRFGRLLGICLDQPLERIVSSCKRVEAEEGSHRGGADLCRTRGTCPDGSGPSRGRP
jgi:hypothetical protein